ncbi:hypothetical protein ACP179_02315 (plasmid) [Xenorhabdus stockiae]|uniref:hypothetical protein n=1 Tax=Xenorhabdus stockiae TaxID=351614 RepID=UPI003CEF6C5F
MILNKVKSFIMLFFMIIFISNGVQAEIDNVMPDEKNNQEQGAKPISNFSSNGTLLTFVNGGEYGPLDIGTTDKYCIDPSFKSVHMKSKDLKLEGIKYDDTGDCRGEDKYVTWKIKSDSSSKMCNIRLLKQFDGDVWWHNVIETKDITATDAPHITGCDMEITAICDFKNCFNNPVNESHVITIAVKEKKDPPSTGSGGDDPGGDNPGNHHGGPGISGCDEDHSWTCHDCPPHAICAR